MHKGHRVQLLPNNKQRGIFHQWAGAHRWAYNFGLDRKIAEYRVTGKSPGAFALMQEIVALKHTEEYAWLQDVAKSVPRMALLHIERAYADFFRRCKGNDAKKGFPKFKSRKRSKTVFHLEPHTVRTEGKRVRIPKIGWVRMTKPLRFLGKLVSSIAVTERAGKWYVSFNVETEHTSAESQGGAIGIDLGVKALVTLSDGTKFSNPKAIKRYEHLLARAQRQLAHKQRGSNHYKRARLRIARIQKRIADIRSDTTHKITRHIADRYELVAMENLNVSGMVRNRSLAKVISDANFYEFKRQIGYKLAWEDGSMILVNRWFPSSKTCSVCGRVNQGLSLADREWTCECGVTHDRDENAAMNILMEARRMTDGSAVTARGGLGVVMPPMKREAGEIIPASVVTQSYPVVNE